MIHQITADDNMACVRVGFPGQRARVGIVTRRHPDGAVTVSVSGNDGQVATARLAAPAPAMDNVYVALAQEFDSPAEAARYNGMRFTYEAPAEMKLTIGDRVLVPVGDKYADRYEREGTVVGLNAICAVDYIKTVIEKLS